MLEISEIFERLGIKGFDELREDERKVYLAWQEILHKPDVTIEDLRKILPIELEKANTELRSHENSEKKDAFYKAYCTILSTLTTIITAPERDRKALEQQLKQKFKL